MKRIRQELLDALELVALPALYAVLPQSWAWLMFGALLRHWGHPYKMAAEQASAAACAFTNAALAPEWRWRFRMVCLLDHADHYALMWRRHIWQEDANAQLANAWSHEREALYLTFHWGAGFPALVAAAAQGVEGRMLVNAPSRAAFQGRTIAYHYIRARIARIERILKKPTLDALTQSAQIARAIATGETLFAVVDVPPEPNAPAIEVSILGVQMYVPRGLLRSAVAKQRPLAVYTSGIDLNSGRRKVTLHPLDPNADVDALARQAFAHLENCLLESPEQWHLWAHVNRFQRPVALPQTAAPTNTTSSSVSDGHAD